MSMSSEKSLVRPKFFVRQYSSCSVRSTSQLLEKAPYLKQLVGAFSVVAGGASGSFLDAESNP